VSVSSLFQTLFTTQATGPEQAWLGGKLAGSPGALPAAFVAAPRFVGRRAVMVDGETHAALQRLLPGYGLTDWTLDRVARVVLLLHLPTGDEAAYARTVETLFDTAELYEAAALYAALPLLAYPDRWLLRATDAVRSNMGPVFDAIALGNPYPAAHFSEGEWNQLVLKSIFNDKPIHRISGLDARANRTLAENLSDLAHERWAAGRQVPPQAWRLVSRFVDERLLADLQTLLTSPDARNQEAAALVSAETTYAPARALLAQRPDLQTAIAEGRLTWKNLEPQSV
jgi:hypothetical protein